MLENVDIPVTLEDERSRRRGLEVIVSEQRRKIALREEYFARFRWRPISEIHEDLGTCVLININDPGDIGIGSNLNTDWDESRWTHFHQIAPLTNEQAEAMNREMEAAK